jgi:peptidoglycan/LPS O-acetylase OafA/YrhL
MGCKRHPHASLPNQRTFVLLSTNRVTSGTYPLKATALQEPAPTRPPKNLPADVAAEPAGHLPALDGLRGSAFLAVFLYHVQVFNIPLGTSKLEQIYAKVTGVGWAGVDLFFVLSGFLITGILIQSQQSKSYYRAFYARRTVRIFPIYYLSLFLFFGVTPLILRLTHRADWVASFIVPSSQASAWSYTLNWRLGFNAAIPVFIGHFWSLSIEEQFYLVWPLMVRRLLRRNFALWCMLLIALSLSARTIFMSLNMESAAYALTICRLDALATGGLIAFTMRTDKYRKLLTKSARALTVSAFVGLTLILMITKHASHATFWMGSIGLTLWAMLFGGILVTALLSDRSNLVRRFTSNKALRFVGKYSYSLYICHQPVAIALSRLGVNSSAIARACHSTLLAFTYATNRLQSPCLV